MGFLDHNTDDDSPEADLPEEEITRPEPENETDPSETPTAAMAFLPDVSTREVSVGNSLTREGSHITFGYMSDTGMSRDKNEDSLFALLSANRSAEGVPDFGIFVVADGMGGYEFGDKASAVAVRIVAQEVLRTIYYPLLELADLSSLPPVTDVLVEAVRDAGAEIYRKAPRGGSDTPGTTCTAAMILRNRAFIAHVGDSRAYLIEGSEIEQLTVDHSVVEYLVQQGTITEEQAETHPRRHELHLALGVEEEVEPDIMSRGLTTQSRLLLCSDGLWNLVDEEDMVSIVNGTHHPQDACDKLVALANTRGGDDNITVILLQVD